MRPMESELPQVVPLVPHSGREQLQEALKQAQRTF